MKDIYIQLNSEEDDDSILSDDAVIENTLSNRNLLLENVNTTSTNSDNVTNSNNNKTSERRLTDNEIMLLASPTVYSESKEFQNISLDRGIDNPTIQSILKIYDLCSIPGIPVYFFDKLMDTLRESQDIGVDLSSKSFTSYTRQTLLTYLKQKSGIKLLVRG